MPFVHLLLHLEQCSANMVQPCSSFSPREALMPSFSCCCCGACGCGCGEMPADCCAAGAPIDTAAASAAAAYMPMWRAAKLASPASASIGCGGAALTALGLAACGVLPPAPPAGVAPGGGGGGTSPSCSTKASQPTHMRRPSRLRTNGVKHLRTRALISPKAELTNGLQKGRAHLDTHQMLALTPMQARRMVLSCVRPNCSPPNSRFTCSASV